MITRVLKLLRGTIPPLLAVLAAGCFQIETLVKIHVDGSATITERYQISRRLLEFKNPDGRPMLASELSKNAVLERTKLMGKGISLVSHELRDGDAGARESVSVFTIPDVSQLQYASPFLAIPGYPAQCLMKCAPAPRLQGDPYLRQGVVCIKFDTVVVDEARNKARIEEERKKNSQKPDPNLVVKGPTPADLQILRQVQPMVRDLLEGIQLTFTVECYAPVMVGMYRPLRNQSSGTRRFDLINFSDKDLDAFGSDFLGNEEIMLELQQMNLNGPNIREHLKGYANNLTLPLFHAGPPNIYHVPPSRYYFDKLFAGKTIGQYGTKESQRPAVFEKIGFIPSSK